MKRMDNRGSSSVEWIVGAVFFFVGILLIIVGVFMLKSDQDFKKDAESTTAIITDIERYTTGTGKNRKTHRNVYITYEIDGKKYEDMHLNVYTSSMYEGKEITVYYHKDNPGDVRYITNFPLTSAILWGMGVIFGGVGGALCISKIKASSKRKKLMSSGRQLRAMIDDVETVTNYTVNGQHPVQIICHYDDSFAGTRYMFRSGNTFKRFGHIDGGTVLVYVDSSDFSKYYVDVDTVQPPENGPIDGMRVVDFT